MYRLIDNELPRSRDCGVSPQGLLLKKAQQSCGELDPCAFEADKTPQKHRLNLPEKTSLSIDMNEYCRKIFFENFKEYLTANFFTKPID